MQTNCQPGDLAIVDTATNPSNIGLVVHVLHEHPKAAKFTIPGEDPLWTTECSVPMTWAVGNRLIHRKTGPIPDRYLRPIRGAPVPDRRQLQRPRLQGVPSKEPRPA